MRINLQRIFLNYGLRAIIIKWRAMRSCGISEDYCTGGITGKEQFEKFAYTLQYAIGNPFISLGTY